VIFGLGVVLLLSVIAYVVPRTSIWGGLYLRDARLRTVLPLRARD
jgi:hypothetical protein